MKRKLLTADSEFGDKCLPRKNSYAALLCVPSFLTLLNELMQWSFHIFLLQKYAVAKVKFSWSEARHFKLFKSCMLNLDLELSNRLESIFFRTFLHRKIDFEWFGLSIVISLLTKKNPLKLKNYAFCSF